MASASRKPFPHSDFLERTIECSLCNERYNDKGRLPKILKCGHEFCLECIEKLETHITFRPQGEIYDVYCPICQQRNELPSRLRDLTTNFTVLSLSEHFKVHDRQSTPTTEGESAAEFCDCQEQFSEDNFNYCKKCRLAVCNRCAWVSHKEHANDCHTAESYLRNLKRRVNYLNESRSQALESLQIQLAECNSSLSLITGQAKEASEAVKKQFVEVLACLSEREAEMLSVIQRHEAEQVARIQGRREMVESEISRLQGSLSETCNILDDDNTSLIRMRDHVSDVLAKNEDLQMKEIPEPHCTEYLMFKPSDDAAKMASELPIGQFLREDDASDKKTKSKDVKTCVKPSFYRFNSTHKDEERQENQTVKEQPVGEEAAFEKSLESNQVIRNAFCKDDSIILETTRKKVERKKKGKVRDKRLREQYEFITLFESDDDIVDFCQ